MNVIIWSATGREIFFFRTCDSLVSMISGKKKFYVIGKYKGKNGHILKW